MCNHVKKTIDNKNARIEFKSIPGVINIDTSNSVLTGSDCFGTNRNGTPSFHVRQLTGPLIRSNLIHTPTVSNPLNPENMDYIHIARLPLT